MKFITRPAAVRPRQQWSTDSKGRCTIYIFRHGAYLVGTGQYTPPAAAAIAHLNSFLSFSILSLSPIRKAYRDLGELINVHGVHICFHIEANIWVEIRHIYFHPTSVSVYTLRSGALNKFWIPGCDSADGMFQKFLCALFGWLKPPIHRQRIISCLHSLIADLWPSADTKAAFCLPTTDRKLYNSSTQKSYRDDSYSYIVDGS